MMEKEGRKEEEKREWKKIGGEKKRFSDSGKSSSLCVDYNHHALLHYNWGEKRKKESRRWKRTVLSLPWTNTSGFEALLLCLFALYSYSLSIYYTNHQVYRLFPLSPQPHQHPGSYLHGLFLLDSFQFILWMSIIKYSTLDTRCLIPRLIWIASTGQLPYSSTDANKEHSLFFLFPFPLSLSIPKSQRYLLMRCSLLQSTGCSGIPWFLFSFCYSVEMISMGILKILGILGWLQPWKVHIQDRTWMINSAKF